MPHSVDEEPIYISDYKQDEMRYFVQDEMAYDVLANGELQSLEIKNNGKTIINTPRIIFDDDEDIFELNELLDDILPLPGYAPDEKAKQLWKYLSDRTYHTCSAGFGYYWPSGIFDIINDFGFGCCDQVSRSLASLFSAAGFPVRVTEFPFHAVSETYYDDAWHMFDPDHKIYYIDNIGRIASVEYIHEHPEIVTYDPMGYDLEKMRKGYSLDYTIRDHNLVPNRIHYGFDYHLYPGESIRFAREMVRFSGMSMYGFGTASHINPSNHVEGVLKQILYPHQTERYSSEGMIEFGDRIILDRSHEQGLIQVPIPYPFVVRGGEVKIYVEGVKDDGVNLSVGYIEESDQTSIYPVEVESGVFVFNIDTDVLIEFTSPRRFGLLIELENTDLGELPCVDRVEAEWYFTVSRNVLPLLSDVEGRHKFRYIDNNFASHRNVLVRLNDSEYVIDAGDELFPCIPFRPVNVTFDNWSRDAEEWNYALRLIEGEYGEDGIYIEPHGEGRVLLEMTKDAFEGLRLLPKMYGDEKRISVSYDNGKTFYVIPFGAEHRFSTQYAKNAPYAMGNDSVLFEITARNNTGEKMLFLDHLVVEFGPLPEAHGSMY